MIKIIFKLLLITFFVSCKKELPEIPDLGDAPVFYLKGEMDGYKISFLAGEGSELMMKYSNENGVPIEESGFVSESDFFEMSIFSDNPFKRFDAGGLTPNQKLGFAFKPDTSIATLSIDDMSNTSNVSNFNWILGDEEFQVVNIMDPGVYDISFKVQEPQTYLVTNKVVVGYETKSLFRLNASYVNQLVYASIDEFTENITSIDWYYGSQTFHTTTPYVSLLPVAGTNSLSVKVKFSNGVERLRTILVGDENNVFVEDYVYLIESTNQHVFNSKVALRTKINGELYTTIQTLQDFDAEILIKKNEKYTDPITKKVVYKLDVIIKVKLNKIGTTAVINANLEGTFALGFVN